MSKTLLKSARMLLIKLACVCGNHFLLGIIMESVQY